MPASEHPAEAPVLLVVASDPVVAEVTAFRLELLGYRVVCATSGRDALATCGDVRPDAIVLDLVVPDMDGYELIGRLSDDSGPGSAPILVMSTDAELDCVQRACAAGAKDFIVIPYDPIVLESKLEALLQAVTEPR